MDLDPDEVFRDDDDDPDNPLFQERESTKELAVYLVDASPKMFSTTFPSEDQKQETHFQVALSCILQSLKTQIINRSYDEVAICFFNTREKKNLQDLNGVFVLNVTEREDLDRPTARLLKTIDGIEEVFMKEIGSQYGIVSGSRENSLYNALWAAQALLRKGSAKTLDKRILLFTNEDDPFGSIKGATKFDLIRTTLQRAKDAQDLGISIELLPLSSPNEQFNLSLFYADLIGLEGGDLAQFLPSAGDRLQDMKDQLKKRMFKKRIVRRLKLSITNKLSIDVNSYALIRPTLPGAITWLDSISNRPLKVRVDHISYCILSYLETKGSIENFLKGFENELNLTLLLNLLTSSVLLNMEDLYESSHLYACTSQKYIMTNDGSIVEYEMIKNLVNTLPREVKGPTCKTERSFICADTGALFLEPSKRFQLYKNQVIKFSGEELSEIKGVSAGHLRLLGFKPLSCLKDYHNLRSSTFLYPSDEEMGGSTCIFIALHRSMVKLNRFAVAFLGSPSRPQLVALVAQDEIITAGGQVEPPGMNMLYLPYADDIRHVEELHPDPDIAPRATDDQVKKAAALMKRIDLKDFSVCQFANPALQRHYAVLQALALEEDEMPEVNDETVPDEEGMSRPGVVKTLEEFKLSVYGENYEEEEAGKGKVSEASKKRKAISETASKKCKEYDWADLADNGKLKELSVVELKYYLTAHDLPVSGKKEALISRILSHMGK